jgi:metallo-beta-lactamase class B
LELQAIQWFQIGNRSIPKWRNRYELLSCGTTSAADGLRGIREDAMIWGREIRAASARLSPLCVLSAAVILYGANGVLAQEPNSPPDDSPYRMNPAGPFHIMDNIYVVGETLHLTNYLITTDEGHILIDAGYEESVLKIQENIEALGFNVADIKYLIGSHAHGDHVAGFARMQEITGAQIVAGRRDVQVLEDGGVSDFRSDGSQQWRPVHVDVSIDEGDTLSLGGTVLTARETPGHTKGCTTWTMTAEEDGVEYDVIFFCGVNIANNALPLIGNPRYPDAVADYNMTFEKLKTIPVDVYLGGHGYWFWVEDKLAAVEAGAETNPFIDPEGWQRALTVFEQRYRDLLAAEQ